MLIVIVALSCGMVANVGAATAAMTIHRVALVAMISSIRIHKGPRDVSSICYRMIRMFFGLYI